VNGFRHFWNGQYSVLFSVFGRLIFSMQSTYYTFTYSEKS